MDVKQPDHLPDGVWQTLLRRALTLVDEIATHGGVADPFYTFGGGTVLMLRFQHRLSKDIDLFFPDPQSLGYITPRLSDVADVLCRGQYLEAANFVKLQFDEGEIDFVASANLLPAAQAFERWTLCGRSVRVETAAEIIAKKMWHRGDAATARDVFDLAMVATHAPDALVQAQPFMYRHLDAFAKRLTQPSSNFMRQFEAIDALEFRPTADYAVKAAMLIVDELRAGRDRAIQKGQPGQKSDPSNAVKPDDASVRARDRAGDRAGDR
ncbi:MAG: nucleotidyl transferase AbiEii/AbiGii toxin family protein [Pseudomonadota bacterium]